MWIAAGALALLAAACGGGGHDDAGAAGGVDAKGRPGARVGGTNREAGGAEQPATDGKRGGENGRGRVSGGKRDPNFQEALQELDVSAERIGALVAAGDSAGLRAMWITDDAFEDCHVADANLEAPQAAERRLELLAEFDELAAVELADAERGELLFVNRRAKQTPAAMGGWFVGDRCRIKYWGRVNAIVMRDTRPVTHVEHRFNLLWVEDAWKLLRYVPARPDCTRGGSGTLGCEKLAERLGTNAAAR